jgi:hypothetical protein
MSSNNDDLYREGERRIASSDDAPADVASRLRRKWFCSVLKRLAKISLGFSAGGIPWALFDFDGYGPSVTCGGFATYLVAMGWRARILLEDLTSPTLPSRRAWRARR